MRTSQFDPVRLHLALVVSVALSFVSYSCLHAGEDNSPPLIDPEHVRLARKFVEALDNDHYAIREKAADCLLRLGRAAIEPLEDGRKATSSEVRLRCTTLLITLRGRGMLGVGMMMSAFGTMPAFGSGVQSVPIGMPAELAGIATGDTIIALNGNPVSDNNELQHLVFVEGPARVMDVTVDRAGEKLHLPVLLTYNISYPAPPTPIISLEAELPEADRKGREEARSKAFQTGWAGGQGQFIVVNGVVQQVQPTPSNVPQQTAPSNVQALDADFERLRAEVKQNEADVEKPVSK
ncbi:MAG: S1C family serine protease [Planctomycetota bacterium]